MNQPILVTNKRGEHSRDVSQHCGLTKTTTITEKYFAWAWNSCRFYYPAAITATKRRRIQQKELWTTRKHPLLPPDVPEYLDYRIFPKTALLFRAVPHQNSWQGDFAIHIRSTRKQTRGSYKILICASQFQEANEDSF